MAALPDGTTVRPARLADAQAVRALLDRVDEIELGERRTELAEVVLALGHPEVDLARDSWLLFAADGELVGHGLVRDRTGGALIEVRQYLLPGQLAAAGALFELMEARGVELARRGGAERAVLHLWRNHGSPLDAGVLTSRGWRPVRRHHVATRAVDPEKDPLPQPPAGVRLRSCGSEQDRRTAHRLIEQTLAEHYDFKSRSYEQFVADNGADRADWSLVWIAELDGHGDVAVLRSHDDRPGFGWATHLGVRAEVRRRGIAEYLMRHFFAVHAARGRPAVGLGFDAENVTGAPELHRKLGMVLDHAFDTWELTLPTGPGARADG